MLPDLRKSLDLDIVIANAENSAAGSGITPKIFAELRAAGVDLMTLGDHAWKRKDNLEVLNKEELCLRPGNYPEVAAGKGWGIVATDSGIKVAHIIVLGRVFMDSVDCPFRTVDAILEQLPSDVRICIVECHAEATSEKVAMGWYLDGRVSAVVGTHTHVPTADERVLPQGTAHISDVGMTGCYNSVIGADTDIILRRFVDRLPVRIEPASGPASICGVVIDIDELTGLSRVIERVRVDEQETGAT
jgi:metallophosphoesterase (TIGR00282 family)